MQATISLRCEGMDEEDLQGLTNELQMTVEQETDVRASLVKGASQPGTKGDPFSIGALVLEFLNSGAVEALLGLLGSFFQRHPTLEIDLENAKGGRMKVRATDLGPEQVNRTIELARQCVEAQT